MKKRGIGILASVLCTTMFLSGCGVLPFEEKSFYSKEGKKAVDVKPEVSAVPEPTAAPATEEQKKEEKKEENSEELDKVLSKAKRMATQYITAEPLST